jgi:hypothetical protein
MRYSMAWPSFSSARPWSTVARRLSAWLADRAARDVAGAAARGAKIWAVVGGYGAGYGFGGGAVDTGGTSQVCIGVALGRVEGCL